MVTYLLIAGALFVGCVAAAFAGLPTLAAAVFPVPVGVYIARGQMRQGLGLVAVTAAAALVLQASFSGMLFFGWAALVGVPLGVGILRRWTFTRTLTVMASMALAGSLAVIAAEWSSWIETYRGMLDEYLELLRKQAGENPEAVSFLRSELEWAKTHWPEIGVGIHAFGILVQMTVLLGLTDRWVRRRFQMPGLAGTFSSFRPTDWLIWAVIAVAALGLLEYFRPGAAPLALVGNAGVALMAVYWLSGLAVAVYAFEVLRPHPLFYLGVLLLVMLSWIHPVLLVAGVADTWCDFRSLVDRFEDARRRREEAGPDDDEF